MACSFEGTPVAAEGLLHLGTRAAVDQALPRLAVRGHLLRVGRGLYVHPARGGSARRPPPSFAGEQQPCENRLGRVSAPPVGHRERHAEITARLGTGLAASLTFANTATHTLESPVNSARFKRPLLLNFKELEDRITVVVFRTAGAGKRQPSPCQRPAPLKAGTTQWNTCDESLTTEHVGSGGVP